jgi:hypothetical protein
MHKQKGKDIVNRRGMNHVIVVNKENNFVLDSGDFIDQYRGNRLHRWRLRGLEHTYYFASNIYPNRLQRGHEICHKMNRTPIPFIQRQATGTFGSSLSQLETHSLSRVDLPNPAGAEMWIKRLIRARNELCLR